MKVSSELQKKKTHTHSSHLIPSNNPLARKLQEQTTMALNSRAAAMATLLVAAAVAVLLAGEQASAAVTCGQVGSSIAPCVAYVTGKAAAVSPGCCSGIRGLNNMARTTADRQAACRCLKSMAGSIKALNMGKVAGVPGKCGVNVGFPISMSTDCNKVT